MAWHNVFQRAAATDSRAPDPEVLEKALRDLRRDTLTSQLGLSTRALNTLDRRQDIHRSGTRCSATWPFLQSSRSWKQDQTRNHELGRQACSHFPQPTIPDRSAVEISSEAAGDLPAGPLNLDALTALLIPVAASTSGKVSRQVLTQFLELEESISGRTQYPTRLPGC